MQPEDLQLLVTTRMPFGKHQDQLICDLPGNYLAWFAREGFPAGRIGQLLALMHEIDHNGLNALLTPLRTAVQGNLPRGATGPYSQPPQSMEP